MIIEQFNLTLNNPVLSHHKAYGQELLPGLAYIDLIYQTFDTHGYAYSELELRQVTLYHPLVVAPDSEIQLTIACTEAKPGLWHIRIEGQVLQSVGRSDEKIRYASAEMSKRTPKLYDETLVFTHAKAAAKHVADLEELYGQCRRQELVHTGFMKAEGLVYVTDTGSVIEIAVGPEAGLHAGQFLFHPVLLDGSGIGSSLLISTAIKDEPRLYLPMYFESFYATEPLRTDCVTRIQNASVRIEKELIYMTLEFFNASGKKVAELKNITSKLVRAAELIQSERKSMVGGTEEISFPTGSADVCGPIELFLRELLAEQLGKPSVEIHTGLGFYQMGLDSSNLLQIVESLGSHIGVSLPPTLLFEYTNIADLAVYLAEHYGEYFLMLTSQMLEEHEKATPHVPETGNASNLRKEVKLPVEQSRAEMPSSAQEEHVDVAIIGMAGRYPMADNLEEFWNNLQEGKDCITEIPASRWDMRKFAGISSPSGKHVSRWGGFIEDPDCFDPQFFRISPREAETMDPQERLFLETCWETIEDAGYTPKTLAQPKGRHNRHRVGVFVGVMHKDYALIGAEAVSSDNLFPLSLNYAQIANRVSYFCNFHGPSMAVDTVCSSSLTAVHLACESIRHGECEVALAGGVNLSLHPNKYLSYSDMHASDGHCRTFGQGGDGYVSGEGVGAVLLKSLRAAVRDGDRIYSVIKGSAINHVGTVSGITVPHPVAQADVIEACLAKAGIDPRTISYVEAHGTGTSLGDPIEIQGLAKAFGAYTQDKQFCSIGSVKSNIGHAESAAGISGLCKVALQLHNQKLVPSLHSEELNPYLELDQTPFYVQQKTEEWKNSVVTDNGKEIICPRRAGLSSFGASGSNAHLILEEYVPEAVQENAELYSRGLAPAIVPLSARNEERLQAYAKKLSAYLHEGIRLQDLAYSLQVGREAMEERAVFIVSGIPELIAKLEAFGDKQEVPGGCWRGHIRNGSLAGTDLSSGEILSSDTLLMWAQQGELHKIAERWVQGIEMDWNGLYTDNRKPRRISAPTYPFARERYWVPEKSRTRKPDVLAAIHPLLHLNTSDFSVQRFSSTFTGEEFFLADHVVKGGRILPGVAYLEIIRAAVEQAMGGQAKDKPIIRIKDVIWLRPLQHEIGTLQVQIALYPEENGEIVCEIYSEPTGDAASPLVYCQSRVEFVSDKAIPPFDLNRLKNEYGNQLATPDECYLALTRMGIDYGPGFKGIKEIYATEYDVLAKICLPSSVHHTEEEFVLHPSLLDAGFHASIGFLGEAIRELASGNRSSSSLGLPFALQELDIIRPFAPEMWSYIRYAKDNGTDDKITTYDIDFCDELGNICVRIKGASIRAQDTSAASGSKEEGNFEEAEDQPPVGHQLLLPVWEPVVVPEASTVGSLEERMFIVGGTDEQRVVLQQYYPQAVVVPLPLSDEVDKVAKKLGTYGEINHIIWVGDDDLPDSLSDDTLLVKQNHGVMEVFRIMKALLRLGYGQRDLNWSLVTIQSQAVNEQDSISPAHAGMHGLAGTMAKEYPGWQVRILDMEQGGAWPLGTMFTLPTSRHGQLFAYRNGQWLERQLIPFRPEPAPRTLYKAGGLYIVIGGAGYIGEVWSEYMIRTYKAQIVWIGRSKLNASIQAKIDRMKRLGPAPEYLSADASDLDALRQAYQTIKKRHPRIQGIVHAAMVLSEQSLENMEPAEFRSGLSAKVDTAVRMAQVFQDEPLDFVLFFSSLVAYIKNVKQSHYASGCAFADSFAHWISERQTYPVKVMNWGYWGNGEVAEDEQFVGLFDQIGLGLIQAEEGMAALEALLTSPVDQVAMIRTTKPIVVEGMNPSERIEVYSPEEEKSVQVGQLPIPRKEILPEASGRDQSREMERLLHKLLFSQLQSLDLFAASPVTPSGLISSHKVVGRYEKWLGESLAILARDHELIQEGDAYSAAQPVLFDQAAIWQEWEAKTSVWRNDPYMSAMTVLVDTTVRALPDILSGQVPATDIMFPGSSMELVEGIYKHNPVADYFNEVLGDTLTTYLQQRLKHDPQTRIRILEIGAGTGGTSAGLFQKLQPFREHVQEYCYTDISRAFLLHAEKKYGPDNAYLTYLIFSVEEPLAGQDVDEGGYDVVIAANVLHATRNIRQTLRNAKALLKNGGLLLLNEMADNSLATHLTFGLLDGWWLSEDPELRIAGCPGLYPEAWRQVLVSEGFPSVIFPAEQAHGLGHQIIAAASNGVIRQKQGPASPFILRNKRAGDGKTNQLEQCNFIEPPGEAEDAVLRGKGTAYLAKLIGETLKIPVHKIDSSVPLEMYGIDSIVVVQLTNTLRKVLDHVTSTLFFECQTIDALVEHFIQKQRDAFMKLLGLEARMESIDIKTADNDETTGENRFVQATKANRFRAHARPESLGSKEQGSLTAGSRDVAIIGVSGRYSCAGSVGELWRNLKEAKNCIKEIPAERWDWKEWYHNQKGKKGTIYTKWGGFIDDYDRFDPSFFQISPLEAERMDPQERVFLETAYASIEDAGYTPGTLCTSRKIGVFVGVMNKYYPTGYGYWSMANRISYLLNFQGPSLAVDTACSSSLTAIHLALESLYSGSSECAVAGGVNLIVDPVHYLNLSTMTMLSSGDKCRAFGNQADGFVDGEGVGAVVLKPLEKAIADGDHIYCVIKGSMINSGGKTNGYTVPNPVAQGQLIKETLERANVEARSISYLEAHGTGTALGDPIEIAGLTRAFESETSDRQYCAIGSIKSNIGHCESAAGIAALTKVLLQFKHGQLTPSLHTELLNPEIDFGRTPFVVQRELAEWKRPVIDGREMPRCAGISSFGAGGANAHLILEEYRPLTGANPSVQANRPALIVLSAKTKEQLNDRAKRLLTAIREERYAEDALMRIAYTMQVGREAMDERLGFLADSMEQLEDKLNAFVEGEGEGEVEGIYQDQSQSNKNALSILAADEDMDKIVEAWISKGKYAKLLELWVKGVSLDWNKLYEAGKPTRIPLPSYPFARERYWHQTPERTSGSRTAFRLKRALKQPGGEKRQTSATAAASAEPFELMTFEEVWREEPLQQNSGSRVRTLLCFLSDVESQKTADQFFSKIDENMKVLFVSQEESEGEASSTIYRMARHGTDTYDKVLKDIQERHGDIDAILYMWPLDEPGSVQDYSRIVFLLQAVLAAQSKPRRILLAGQYGQEADLSRCYLESWIGFERSLGMVMPQTKVSGVYTEVSAQSQNQIGDITDWLRKLWSELHTETAQTALYQGEQRRVTHIEPTLLQAGPSRLRTNGTYLITGGCGGLGFLLAKHLAKRYNANLILTGRSSMDPKKEAIISQLVTLGGQAQYIQADLCDVQAMNTGLSESRQRFGVIHGVFHAAGIQSSQSLEDKEISNFQEILAPKIQGTLILDELLQEDNLDFNCYFSSSAAILGDFGFCDYAVGNRFQMAYAKYTNDRHGNGRAITVNWPVWRDGGMSIGDADTTESYLRSSGQRYLETEEGLDILERVLSQPQLQQQLVLAGQPSRVHRFLGLSEETRQKDQPAARPHGKGRQAHMLGWSTEQCLEADLKNWISELLKHPLHKLKPNIQWMDYGFDSVLLAEFAGYLSDRYQVEFTPSLFFSYTNLDQLIRYLLKEHPICLEEYYRESIAEPEALQHAVSPGEKAAAGYRKVTYKPSVKREMTVAELPEPIAVIGMSGRFPQADHVEEFWQHLKDGTRCITEIPADRWDWQSYDGNPHLEEGKSSSKWGAFLNNVDRFEPLFFKISPKESAEMDPRHRLFLEEAWRTFEDAGYMNERIKGKSCGVYVGVEEGEYAFLVKDSQYINGNQNATLPARIAYMLDLKGPNMAITAACSSGLVAIHQACQALRQGDCEMALVGGINLNISPMSYAALSKAEMLSPDGECRVFAENANGMVPGEAVAAVLLKPLSKAIADQDVIYGCIKASGVNYDGRTNGITSPSPFSQAELVEAIYRKHLIDPLDIQYVMSHSTGSKLGDPLEIQALTSAFSKFTNHKQFCTIGSIKPLIGHTFAASGIVGLIGMLMAMRDRIIPGTRDNGADHPSIVSGDSPFVLSSSNQVWASKDNRPRLGTVSATGISGTNAHIVVEEYVPDSIETDHPATEPSESISQIVVLSAKNEDRLRAACSQLLDYIESRSEISLRNLAYTLQIGREAMDYRLAFVVNDRQELTDMLRAYLHVNKNSGNLATSGRIYAGNGESSALSDEHHLPFWISERDYDRVARHWVEGGHVSWEQLHESGSARRITLPGYPFAGERYWFEDSPSTNDRSPAIPESELNLQPHGEESGQAVQLTVRETIRDAIHHFISQELNLAKNQLKTNTKLLDYGMDSIVGRKLMRHLENAFSIEVSGRELLEYPAIEALAAHLAEKAKDGNETEEAEPALPGSTADYSDRHIIEKMEQFMQGIGEFEDIHQILEGSLKR